MLNYFTRLVKIYPNSDADKMSEDHSLQLGTINVTEKSDVMTWRDLLSALNFI